MRMVFMAYLADSIKAVDFYCKAFKADPKNCFKHSDDDNYYAHAEIIINGQTVLAISDIAYYDMEFNAGANMEFWLTFDDEQSLNMAYDILKENAIIHFPLDQCDWCKALAGLTDKYGIRWLLNVF